MIEQFTNWIVEWIQLQPVSFIYAYFFLIAYLENVVPPIPGDILVAFAGYLIAKNIIGFFPVFSLTVIGSVLGFYHVYFLGKLWGKSVFDGSKSHWLLRFMELEYLETGKKWMNKYGVTVIIVNRFLAGTRSVIALVAGMSQIHLTTTLVGSLISSLLWNTILIGLGWLIHENWQQIGSYLADYGKFVAIILIILVLYNWYKKKSTVKKSGEIQTE